MTNLEQYIYAKLDAMQTEKAAYKVEPNWVTKAELLGEINRDIRTVLNQMFRERKIKVHKTIHSSVNDYVELVKEEK